MADTSRYEGEILYGWKPYYANEFVKLNLPRYPKLVVQTIPCTPFENIVLVRLEFDRVFFQPPMALRDGKYYVNMITKTIINVSEKFDFIGGQLNKPPEELILLREELIQ